MNNFGSQSAGTTLRRFSLSFATSDVHELFQQDRRSSSLSPLEHIGHGNTDSSVLDIKTIDPGSDAVTIDSEGLEMTNSAENELDTRPPNTERSREVVVAEREWDGTVTSIGQKRFYGEMAPVRGVAGSKTEALSYPLSMLSSSERRKITEGSIFRVTVGKTRKSTGHVMPHFSIYFRPVSVVQSIRAESFATEIKKLLMQARVPSEYPSGTDESGTIAE